MEIAPTRGKPTVHRYSYCEEHKAICYQAERQAAGAEPHPIHEDAYGQLLKKSGAEHFGAKLLPCA